MRGSLVPRNIRRLSNGRCLNNDRTAGMLGDLRVDKLAEMRTQARVGSFLVSGFLFGVGGGWNQDEMEDHGTVYATRFKRVRESIEAMKEIWTKESGISRRIRQIRSDDRPAETGPETASANPRRRHFSAWRSARHPLWRWLDSRWRYPRGPAEIP